MRVRSARHGALPVVLAGRAARLPGRTGHARRGCAESGPAASHGGGARRGRCRSGGVRSVSRGGSTREREGGIVLVALVDIIAVTAVVKGRASASDPVGDIRLPRRAPWIALVLICAGLGVAIVAGAHEKAAQTLG